MLKVCGRQEIWLRYGMGVSLQGAYKEAIKPRSMTKIKTEHFKKKIFVVYQCKITIKLRIFPILCEMGFVIIKIFDYE